MALQSIALCNLGFVRWNKVLVWWHLSSLPPPPPPPTTDWFAVTAAFKFAVAAPPLSQRGSCFIYDSDISFWYMCGPKSSSCWVTLFAWHSSSSQLWVNVGGMFRTLYEFLHVCRKASSWCNLKKTKDSKIKDSLFCVRNCELAKMTCSLYSFEWVCGANS